jgi:hypothetical protein
LGKRSRSVRENEEEEEEEGDEEEEEKGRYGMIICDVSPEEEVSGPCHSIVHGI